MDQEVRVRFAPSPTGALHIGGLRTALYNYLFARNLGGKMLLRIEDTDQKRFVEGAEQYIVDALKWCNIEIDEGPAVGGPYGPYKQSERKGIYQTYAQQLLDNGHAYYAFDTAEEIEAMRERLKEKKVSNQNYNAITRMSMTNSLTLPEAEVKARIEAGAPYVIRLKVPSKDEVRFQDIIRDWVHVHSSVLDDKVLMKSDGLPTYHLANVVDDHLMKITHVIRGEEWLSSTPLHVLLYQFLGWAEHMPIFAHLPLLLKPDGKGKLSKRDGKKFGFPVFPFDWTEHDSHETYPGFREAGFLQAGFVNFIAMLGWNPGTEQELFNLKELEQAFALEKVHKAGAKFDYNKARWFNEQHLRQMPANELLELVRPHVHGNGVEVTDQQLTKICELMKDRITFPADVWHQGQFFFVIPDEYDAKAVKKKWSAQAAEVLSQFGLAIAGQQLSAEQLKEKLAELATAAELSFGKVMPALRIALTGAMGGPDLFETIGVLGTEQTAQRINKAVTALA